MVLSLSVHICEGFLSVRSGERFLSVRSDESFLSVHSEDLSTQLKILSGLVVEHA